jgi:transcriptional regulator with XRE-family HTH domain
LEGQELAARHIALRERAGLTQEQEAKIAGVSPTTISGIESGKIMRPHLKTLLKIAQALGVDVEELRELGKAESRSSPEASLNDVLDEERRNAALKHLPGVFRRCAEEWRKALEHLEQQEPHWFWVVQAAANDFTDMLYRSDLLHKIHELRPEDFTPEFFQELAEGGQQREAADPELVAAVDLVDAFIEMHDAAEEVLEAADAWEDAWLANNHAEHRRAQFREMTREIA